jgi:hypothetical protein
MMEKRHGSDPRELSDCNPDAAPSGEPFDEDTVADICPKLASRFE